MADSASRRAEWVETYDSGRCRLEGNAHTFPGRIAAWSETDDAAVTISRSDLRDASAEAWAWIDGFLAGAEPELHEFLGIPADEADELSPDDDALSRYALALATFRETGSFPFALTPRPTMPPPTGLAIEPWLVSGGEVLGWTGGEWLPLDPQPELHHAFRAGTVCDERGYHQLAAAGDRHMFCGNCGELTEMRR